MNILLIIFAIILIWRIGAGMKRGVVREAIAFINVLFVAFVLGIAGMIFDAYHKEQYVTIVIMFVLIVILSIIYSVLKLVFFPAKVITKLPVISTVDRLLGFIMGAGETLFAFWAMCCLLMYMDFGVLGQQAMSMIYNSKILAFLYRYNLLGVMLETVKSQFL